MQQATLPLFVATVPVAPEDDGGGERRLRVALARLRTRARARFDPRHQFFRRADGTAVRGLTRLLERTVVPERVRRRWAREREESRAYARRSGRAVGERVHRQLQHLVRCMRGDDECTCAERTNPRALSAPTASVLRTLASLRLRVVDAERAVYSTRGHYATAVDLLCTPADAPGALVLVSVKTGCGVGTRRWREERTSAERCEAPFDDVPCTRRELAQLQLFAERSLLTAELDTPVQRALVLYCVPPSSVAAARSCRVPLRVPAACLPAHLRDVELRASGAAPLCYTEEAAAWHTRRPQRYATWCAALRRTR